jgi:hypothetical protein
MIERRSNAIEDRQIRQVPYIPARIRFKASRMSLIRLSVRTSWRLGPSAEPGVNLRNSVSSSAFSSFNWASVRDEARAGEWANDAVMMISLSRVSAVDLGAPQGALRHAGARASGHRDESTIRHG